jgi:drug/metabolite transporter (DMT)-like permease
MQKTTEEAPGQGPRAVLALLGSAFMFSLMTLGVKHLGPRLPVAELVLARSIVGLSISLGMARLLGINPWGRRRGLLALRGLLGTMALGCIFAALKRLPLAEATVLQFLYPTLTAALAWTLLGESPSRHSLGALLIGWVGVLVLVRPGSGVFPMGGVLLALAGALFTSLAYVSVRELANTESPLVIVIWFPMVSGLLSLPLVMLHPVAPTGNDLLWLLAIGLFTQAGQLGLTEGLARLPAARATPIGYVQVAFASLWGWWVFGEKPGPTTLLGGGLVLLAALLSQTGGPQALGASGKGKG